MQSYSVLNKYDFFNLLILLIKNQNILSYIRSMKNQKIAELQIIFKELDTDHDSLLSENEMKQYLKNQKINFASYTLKEVFISGNQKGKINCRDFISYLLALQLGLQVLGVIKINIDRSSQNHADANPIEISNQIMKSFLNFVIEDKNQKVQQKEQPCKQRLKLQININKSKQNEQLAFLKQIFGRQLKSTFLVLSLKVKPGEDSKQNGEKIAESLKKSLNQLKQLVCELSPEFQKILNIVQISTKFDTKTGQVFGLCEINNIFVQQLSKSIDQFITVCSPNCNIKFGAQLKSSVFGSLLTKTLDEVPTQFQLSVSLDADQTSIKKTKRIFDKQVFFNDKAKIESQKLPVIIFFMLFEEVQFQTHFSKASQFFQAIGFDLKNNLNVKDKAGMLKNMQIKQMLAGFSPETLQLLTQLKDHCEPSGYVSLCAKDCTLKVLFDLNIKGAFQLLDI